MNMNLLYYLNRYFFQFLFIRLCNKYDRFEENVVIMDKTYTYYRDKLVGFGLLIPIVPFTGWNKIEYIPGDYKYLHIKDIV